MNNVQLTFEKLLPVALPSLQSRVHSVHTTSKTARKRMAAAIPLLLPTPAQEKIGGFVQKSETQFLPESKPHAQKLLMQFLRHFSIHRPEIEANSTVISKLKKSEILKDTAERKKGKWHDTACNRHERKPEPFYTITYVFCKNNSGYFRSHNSYIRYRDR
jgi:hypothetical protein